MCRISAIDPSTATGAAQHALEAAGSKFGMVPMMARTMAQSGAVVAGWEALRSALADGALGARTGELVALAVAHATREARGEARPGGRHEGGRRRPLSLLILETRGRVSDDDLAVARAGGLSEAETCEVLAHVALNVFTNYFNRLADTEIDFPKVDVHLPTAAV